MPATGITQLETAAGYPKNVHPQSTLGKAIDESRAILSGQKSATSVKDQAFESFKGWTPTVIKGGKDKLATGGMAKLNAELNQLPEYYLPMADGGIANHFRKK